MADTAEFLTFLFTDIEGSTALWERHPIEMETVVARHDEMLRTAVDGCGGHVVKSTGDGLHAVFRSPRDGVRAALDGQRAITKAEWPEGIDLRVRMGVHAGEATGREGDWFGTEVNRAARVMSVGHGGQVVCTRIVEELVRSDDFDLVDLGEHRLRDLQSTVHLFQVEIPGAPKVHAPLRSVDAHLTNLPYELSSFIGREAEQDDVARRLGESRLVTIVGVGGVGKTRLALEVGGASAPRPQRRRLVVRAGPRVRPGRPRRRDRSARCATPLHPAFPCRQDCSSTSSTSSCCSCSTTANTWWVPSPSSSPRRRPRAPAVSVLATSREALGVRGEHIYPLTSLTIPSAPDVDTVLTSEAGALFASRAREAGGELTLDERNATRSTPCVGASTASPSRSSWPQRRRRS